MVTILIGLVLGLLVTLKTKKRIIIEYGIFGGIIVGMLVAFLIPLKIEEKTYVYKIETLQDNQSISGKSFLGSGQVDGVMHYVFYYRKNGFIEMEQLRYDQVKIQYSDEKPKIVMSKNVKIQSDWNYFALGDITTLLKPSDYIIYIPKGTIKNDYQLDAK